jgi:hypothetical protein
MDIVLKFKNLCKFIKIACIGKRMRKRLLFEKILGHANRHWFAYPQPVFKTLCNDLALQFRGDFTSLYDLDINHFDLFQRRAHALSNKDKSVRCIPIDVLKIKSINSFKYKVELLRRNLDFDRDDPDSEPFKVAMCYDVQVSFNEIERELWLD